MVRFSASSATDRCSSGSPAIDWLLRGQGAGPLASKKANDPVGGLFDWDNVDRTLRRWPPAPAAALRDAQLAMIAAGAAHPYHWAAFVVVGPPPDQPSAPA